MTPTFDEVYAEHHRSVVALCRRLLGSDADAQDAAQDAFLAVARGLHAFRGDASVKTWVHRIAIRAAMRTRAHRRDHVELDDREPGGQEVRARRLDVARALAGLSMEHRLVLAMFSVEGFSHPEIAKTLGIPEGTVWSRLHAAKKQLAASLGG